MTDEEELKALEIRLANAPRHEKTSIQALINNKKRLIEHKRIQGSVIVARATEQAANIHVQTILDSTGKVLEAMNEAAQVMSTEARQLTVAIEEADKSSSLVGRAVVILGTAAWFSLAWDVAKTVTSDGHVRAVIMGTTGVLLAAVLAWCGIFRGLFRTEKVCEERENETLLPPNDNP
jgi:hypothetical protein